MDWRHDMYHVLGAMWRYVSGDLQSKIGLRDETVIQNGLLAINRNITYYRVHMSSHGSGGYIRRGSFKLVHAKTRFLT